MSRQERSVGDLAPDFRLTSAAGEDVHLYETLAHSAVVLFFYVGNFTPVCTAEACSFRENAERFRDLNAKIYGVSSGSELATRHFVRYHKLPFPVLLDRSSHVRNLFGVPRLWGLLPGRSTYVIGKDRRIMQITTASFEAQSHVVESLNFLRGNQSR